MTAYKELEASAAKLSDDDLIEAMETHARALSVLWREAENREKSQLVPSGVNGLMIDERYGKRLYVSVDLSDRRGIHISAIKGERIR